MAHEKELSERELQWLIDGVQSQGFEKRRRKYGSWFLVLSALLNVFLIFIFFQHNIHNRGNLRTTPAQYFQTNISPYSGIARDTPHVYDHHSDYVSDNETLANQKWSELESILVIAVTEDWVQEKDLPHSWRFPWDREKRIYFLKIGHQLHCLKSIREALREYSETGSTRLNSGHLEHCVDTLRQDLMCYADDTPMPSVELINGAGENQVLQCKDWSKVREWIYAPERHACHRHINEFAGVNHTITRYGYCPKDSPYYPAMKEYFDKHGYLDQVVEE